ncbi:hypothetical protein SKAU_G00412560 [Synaphobranchus kaupii]|uniref:Uncharacterized protein n=1 Tax=Synaphobranchus kaupii TaxID=118154 RepID=A0A9Q1E854_SYNKA|nr:hypothetical protein SKAU_G00412560 [Synaphobranchus kaupii]
MVTQWSFENGGCAAEERRVWYLCTFSDGQLVVKAHLYDFRGVVEEGGCYILKGHIIISNPPRLAVPREATFYSSMPIVNGCRATLCLWREATTWEVRLGQMAAFTHLTSTASLHFGQQWSTGNYSTIDEETEVLQMIKVIGASILEGKEVEILLEDLDVLKVAADVWEGICPQLAYSSALK